MGRLSVIARRQPRELGLIFGRKLRSRRRGRSAFSGDQQREAAQRHEKRPDPQHEVGPAQRRAKKDEVTIAGDEKAANLAVGPSGRDLGADQAAEIGGEGRIGVVDRLTLADDAAGLAEQ